MNILVTGGTGYIGSHTCIALIDSGYQVVIVDNLSNSSIKVLDQIQKITGIRPAFVQGDVRNLELLEKVMVEQLIDAVIHFAALKAVGESTEKPIEYYGNNVTGSLTVLKAMQHAGVKHLVFSSSATVYGNPEYIPLDENHPIRSTNPYGWSKVIVERILEDVVSSDSSMLVTSLRYFNPVGAHVSGELGEDPLGIPNNLLPFVAQVAVGRLDQVKVFGGDYDTLDGTGVRDYIHVLDLAEGHVSALRVHQGGTGFNVYNLGTGQGYSVLQVINAFEQSCGKKIPYQITARRAGDVACNYADPAKAKSKLHWQAQRNLQQMTDDAWLWQKKYPNGLK